MKTYGNARLTLFLAAAVGGLLTASCAIDSYDGAGSADTPIVSNSNGFGIPGLDVPDFRPLEGASQPSQPTVSGEGHTHEPAVPQSGCGFGPTGSSQPLMLEVRGPEVALVRGDGSRSLIIDTALETPEGLTWNGVGETQLRGDRILVSASYRDVEQPYGGDSQSALWLFSLRGDVLWHGSYPWAYALMSRDGALAISGSDNNLIVTRDGSEWSVGDDRPSSAPRSDGAVLVTRTTVDDGYPYGRHDYLWRYPDGTERSSSLNTSTSGRLQVLDEWTLWTVQTEVGHSLQAESVDGVLDILLGVDSTDESYYGYPMMLDVSDQGRILVSLAYTDRSWVVDLNDATANEITIVPPEGMRPFDLSRNYYVSPAHPELRFGQDESIVLGFRDDTFAQLFRSDDLGATWTPVGVRLREVDYVSGHAFGGTLGIVAPAETYGYYGSDSQWEEAPAGSEYATGSMLHVIDSQGEVERMFTFDESSDFYQLGFSVSEDGRCFSYRIPTEEGATVQIVDMSTGAEQTQAVLDHDELSSYRTVWISQSSFRSEMPDIWGL